MSSEHQSLPRWVPRWYRSFWSSHDVCDLQLACFRVAFFALLAIDAFLLIAHAPRYGAGNFNVSHIPALDPILPSPTHAAIVVGALVACYLAARVAIGVRARLATRLLFAIYIAIYVSSQLDSFQHHYLLALLLLTACFISWSKSADGERSWPLRLLLLQVSVVYIFAAITKMETGWWDGRALAAMIEGFDPSWTRAILENIGTGPAAKITVMVELSLAVAIHVRVLRIPAALLGIALHLGIELAGFDIGLFSYYMIAIYLLVLPPFLFRWARVDPGLVKRLRDRLARGPGLVWAGVALVGGAFAVGLTPLPGAWIAAALVAAIGAISYVGAPKRGVAVAHIAAAIAVLACSLSTDAIKDHYRFWGGSARRLGDLGTSLKAYKQLVDLEPDGASGRRNLGDLYRRHQRFEEAVEQYRIAVRIEPDAAVGHLGLARVYGHMSRASDAVSAAARARRLAEADSRAATPAMRRVADEAREIESLWRRRL